MTRNIIIQHETAFQSIIADTYSFCTGLGLIGVGWLLNSSAMQWLGFVVFWIVLIGKTVNKRLSIAEARAKLDEIEKEQAQ